MSSLLCPIGLCYRGKPQGTPVWLHLRAEDDSGPCREVHLPYRDSRGQRRQDGGGKEHQREEKPSYRPGLPPSDGETGEGPVGTGEAGKMNREDPQPPA